MKLNNKMVLITLAILFFGSGAALGEGFVIDQKNKRFSETNIKIKQGDTVIFTNSDPMSHNIHSLTYEDPFDLGSYQKGEVREHTFKSSGLYEIECAIHPFMFLTIEVEE